MCEHCTRREFLGAGVAGGMILAGATLLGVGTAVYYEGIDVFDKLNKGIQDYLDEHGFKSISEIRGTAHE